MAGPFDAYLEQKKQQEAARTATQMRMDPADPDAVASGLTTAKELGEAPGKVLAFQQHFSDLLAQKRATTALTGAPKMSDWLRTDPAGAIAKDDLDNLSWWEKGFRQFADMGGAVTEPGVNAVKRGVLSTGQAVQQQQAVAAQQRAGDAPKSFGQILWDAREPIMVGDKEVSREFADPFDFLQAGYRYVASRAGQLIGNDEQANAAAFQQSAETIRRRVSEIPMSPAATAVRDQLGKIDGSASWGEQLSAFGQVIADDPGGFASFLAQVGAESLPGMAAAMGVGAVTRSPTAAAATMGAFSGGREYGATVGDELAKAGHDLTTRDGALAALQDEDLLASATEKGKARALTIGIIDGLSGGLASKQLLSNPLGDAIVQAMSQAVMGGSGEALGQLAAEGRITSLSDVLVEAMAEFITTPAEVASVGGRGLFRDSNRAQRAGSTAGIIDQASQQAQASKVRARSPDAFKAALDKAGRGDDLLYVPAQGLREFFQARDLDFDREMAEAWGIDLDTMAEMEISGGQVAVPVSNFAAYLAGTDAEAWLRENATLEPDEMSLSDAQAFDDAMQDMLEQGYQRDLDDMRAEQAAQSSDQQVFDGLYSQLRSAGRTADVAQNESRVMTAFFRTMAQRVGEDSLDLARRFGLRIQGPDAPGIPRRRGSLDVMLNDMRAGRKEKVGRTLTEFVIDAGGVQDVGGDVAALEGPQGLVGESREEIRARQAQATLDGMPSTGKGLALDDLGRMAVEAGYFPELIGETQGLNKGEASDLGAALLDALREEASGRARYVEGDGPDPARAALNAALQERGLDPAAMTNDEIAAALDEGEGATFDQAPATDSDAFRAWFGDSKVVGADGKPLVVYHGAPDVRDILVNGFKKSPTRGGVYFASDKQAVANTYADDSRAMDYQNAEPHVIPLYMALKNPLEIDANGQKWRETEKHIQQARDGGHDGLIIRNSRDEYNNTTTGGALSTVYVAFEPTQMKSAMTQGLRSRIDRIDIGGGPNRGTFDPADPRILYQQRRGSIQFPAGGPATGETIISLFETADLSTFTHEAAHFFLETLDALAADPNAPQAVKDEAATVRSYLGAEDGAAFTTEQHETFARSFEAYMLEGKAPSLELADVFGRVKAWLVRIYRSIAGLNVPINDEIRGVFDRLLATDDEIAQARAEGAADPLFREKPAGMTDGDWATYQRLARRSKEQAEAKLLDKTMDRVRREKQKWWKDERKQVRSEVEAMINAEPRFRLTEALANGRFLLPEGERAAPDMRLDRKALVDQFGAGVLAEMSRQKLGGKRAIYGDDGMTPDAAADMFGFASAADMVETLQNTGKRVDAIDAETDRIMLDRYGDVLTDGTIEQEAMDAIHNDQQAQKNVAEARQIATQLGRDTRGMTSRLYRQRARMMLGRMTVREAAQPARFLAAERRAGKDAERAFAKVVRGDAGSLAVALQAKEQQILNAALYDLSREAEAEVGKAREKMQAYGKKSVREKLEGGYIEQIDDLLDRYDFRRRGPGQVAKTERLREFIDRMIADGREAELMIDPRMMDEARRVHYSRLSLDEFRGLTDTIANLDHLGRFKQKLINGKKQRELAEVVNGVADAIEKNVGTGRIKQESRVRSFLDLVFTADTVLVDMDGGDEFGHSYQSIKEDIDAGYVRVDEMNRELSIKLDELFSVYSAKEMREMKAEKHINGTRFTWPKWKAIAVALNTGNDDNMARLLAENAHPENRMTRDDLDAILDTLDKRDWDFVQSMWDLVNSYWPEIEAVTQRRTGVKPGKVEPRQVVTKHGTYRGGYYPIKYDAGLGHAAAVDARTEMDRFMSAGRFAKAQTKHGHTVERKANGNGRSLNLDMDVAFSHLRDVIRDIGLSEAVDNSYRVLNHPQVAQAFMEAGRKNDLDMMNLWLKDVAQGPIVHSDVLNQFARIVKNNFTLSRLALNFKTVTLQVTGVAQSAATVGKRNMAHAFADYLKRPGEASREVLAKSEFMRRRQTTFDKDIQDFNNDTFITSPMRGRVSEGVEWLARAGFAPMVKTQFYAVDVPTWMAGYRSGLRKFDGDDARAVAFADRMVARAQDSGSMPDRSAVSRGTLAENARQLEWVRLFTTLQGYMIAKFNRGYLTARQGVREIRTAETVPQKFAATADMATNMMLIYVAESLMMGLLYAAMAQGDDDDDLTGEKFLTWTAGEVAGTVVGGLPLVRDGWAMFKPYATGGGVYGSVMEIPARVVQQVTQGENDKALRRAVSDAVGLATGLPTVATMRPIEEMLDEDTGSVMEAIMGRNPLVD